MLGLAQLYAPIAADIDASARIFRDELISDQDFICDICQHVSQFHGKRLRPALLLLAARACGAVRPAHHVLAAVVEMVHIATLVHDDVLDEADIRRRAATVNRLWGNERAVLMGDLLISHAFHLCSSLDSQFASRIIGHTTNTVCEGELMQNYHRDNFELTEAEYLDIITRKTAVLVGACCYLGAHFAGADERTSQRMRQFGESLGIAFQITDDLLDLTGDEAEAGKSLGRDVYKGKLTLPLIHYLRTCGPAERASVLAVIRGESPSGGRYSGAGTGANGNGHTAAGCTGSTGGNGDGDVQADGIVPADGIVTVDGAVTANSVITAGVRSTPAVEGPVRDMQRYRTIARYLANSDSIDYATRTAHDYVAAAQRMLQHLPRSEARSSLAAMTEFVLTRKQ